MYDVNDVIFINKSLQLDNTGMLHYFTYKIKNCIMIDIVDSDSCLRKLMFAFTEVERLRDDNKYFCDTCLSHVEAERSLHYQGLPNILTLHLKRFSTSSGYIQI